MFDIVSVALPPVKASAPTASVLVLRGLVGAEETLRPPTRRELATLERDSTWLMRLAICLSGALKFIGSTGETLTLRPGDRLMDMKHYRKGTRY